MNKFFIVVLSLSLLITAGCKRSSKSSTGSTILGAENSNSAPADSKEARSFLEKGKLLYRDDQDSEAAEAFKQAISLDPTIAEAYFRLALTYDALNKAEEAEKTYKLAVERYKKYFDNDENANDAEARYNLGQTYAGLHQYSDAIREFKQATKIRSDDADIYYDMGMAQMKLAQYSEATTAFSKSLEIDPDNYRAQDALDEAREGMKRIQAGKKHQEDLLKKEQDDELKKASEGVPSTAPSKPKGIKG